MSTKETQSEEAAVGTIPTVTCAAAEFERLKIKAEIYDLLAGISQANQRIAKLEQSLLKNV